MQARQFRCALIHELDAHNDVVLKALHEATRSKLAALEEIRIMFVA